MIKEFELNIYPRKVWIASKRDCKEIFNRFTYYDGKKVDIKEFTDSDAVCMSVRDSNNKLGELIVFNTKKTPSLITHESIHAAMDIMQQLDIMPDFNNQEPLSYLAGYIAKCCS